MEYAGVVLECGPLCKRFKVGDRVCGVQDTSQKKLPGTWAEQTLAPEEHVVPLPSAISFVEAASVGMASFVAGDMFQRAKKKLPATGGRCLVIGASGGLGSVLLQMLRKEEGLFIAAVCSGANAGTVRRLGAELVVDYTLAPFEEQLAGTDRFDVVFDFVGGSETQQSAVPLLRRGGQFITAVGPWKYLGDRQLSLCEWTGWACGLAGRLLGSCLPLARFSYEMPAFLPPLKEKEFNEVVVAGGARAEIALQVPLAEAPLRDALSRVASRHPGGKVLINLDLK
jgi:alcohol dehydrogenase